MKLTNSPSPAHLNIENHLKKAFNEMVRDKIKRKLKNSSHKKLIPQIFSLRSLRLITFERFSVYVANKPLFNFKRKALLKPITDNKNFPPQSSGASENSKVEDLIVFAPRDEKKDEKVRKRLKLFAEIIFLAPFTVSLNGKETSQFKRIPSISVFFSKSFDKSREQESGLNLIVTLLETFLVLHKKIPFIYLFEAIAESAHDKWLISKLAQSRKCEN